MLRVLIVDDEPLARENLRVLLQEQPDIEIVGECERH
jgi:two-component system LytT family response regulator